MRKGLFSVSLLALAGMMFSAVVACTPASEPEPGPVNPPLGNVYTIEITNKADLQAEWFDNGTGRKVELKATLNGKEQNVTSLISEGDITITSSNKEAATVTGQMVSPKAAGETTIEASYGDKKDSVKVTVTAHPTNKDLFGTDHEGTLEDPFTNEDALKAAKYEEAHGGFTATEYYFKGEVDAFYHAPGSRGDQCSWYMKPAQAGGERFEIYLCKKADASDWVTTDLWKGAVATAHGAFAKYNTQYETGSAVLDKVEGTAPNPPVDINATVAEALTAGKALADGDSSWDNYVVTGYVVKKDGANFFMADAKEAAANDKDMLELYNVKDETVLAGLLQNAKVKVKMNLKNYHGQIENSGNVVAANFEVLEAGEAWEKPQATEVNVAQALEKIKAIATPAVADFGEKTSLTLYVDDGALFAVTGTVTKLGNWSDSYGNGDAYIADAAGDVENTLQLFRINVKDIFDLLVVDQTVVKATGKLAAYFTLNEGVVTLKACETAAAPEVEIISGGKVVVDMTDFEVANMELEIGEFKNVAVTPLPAGAELGNRAVVVSLKAGEAEDVVSIEGTKVTGLKAGSVVLEVKVGELEAVKEMTVTVAAPAVDYKTLEADLFANSFTADAENAKLATFSSGIATFTLNQHNSSSANRLSDADHLRVYAHARLEFALSGGNQIAKIELTCTAASYANVSKIIPGEGNEAVASDTLLVITLGTPASSYALECNEQVRVNKAKIYYVEGQAPAEPVEIANGEEATAIANPGTFIYWNDQNWCGSNVTVGDHYIDGDGAIHLSYTSTGACEWGLQLFYENAELQQNDKLYKLEMLVTAEKDCHVRLQDGGADFELKAGVETAISRVAFEGQYTQQDASLVFLVPVSETANENSFVIKDIKWSEPTPVSVAMVQTTDLIDLAMVDEKPCYVVRVILSGDLTAYTGFELYDGELVMPLVKKELGAENLLTLYFDISSLDFSMAQFWPHLRIDGTPWNGAGANGDIKNNAITSGALAGKTLDVGDTQFYIEGSWNLPTLKGKYIGNAAAELGGATLLAEGEKVYLVLSGTSSDAKPALFKADVQLNGGSWTTTALTCETVVEENGNWTLKADITALVANERAYNIHWFLAGQSSDIYFENFEEVSVVFSGKTFTLKNVDAAWGGGAIRTSIVVANAEN